MTRSTTTYRRIVRRLALGLMLAAIAVPAAHAGNAVQPLYTVDAPRSGPSAGELRVYSTDGPRSGGLIRVAPAPARGAIDWRDAGIGAATGVGLCLVFGAALLLVARRRQTAAGV
jgi:hypothetical protein